MGFEYKVPGLKIVHSLDPVGAIIGEVGEREIDFFEMISDQSIMNTIVDETNLYAAQKQSKNWTEFAVDELKAFIGCLIIMGIHKLPNLSLGLSMKVQK